MLLRPLLDIAKVFALTVQQERHMLLANSISTEPPIFFNQSMRGGMFGGRFCGRFNGSRGWSHSRPICTFCGLLGHVVDQSYKKQDFPIGYQTNNSTKGIGVHIAAIDSYSFASSNATSFFTCIFESTC